MNRPATSLFAALVLALAGTVASAAQDVQRYSLSAVGLPVGSLTMAANREGDRYTVRGKVEGGGVAGLFVDFSYNAVASGRLDRNGMPVPVIFDGTRKLRDDGRRTQISYSGGTPTEVSFDPAKPPRPFDIDPRAQKGTLDPASATYALLRDLPAAAGCARTVDIFDGTRRSRITVGAERPVRGGLQCDGVYTRIAGYPPDEMAEQVNFPFRMVYRQVGDMLQVERFETDSIMGSVVARRQ